MLILPGGRVIRVPSATIPFELFGMKISVTTTGGGAKVSVKLDDVGKYIAREYLGRIFPTSSLTELINSYLDIKFKCNASLSYNFKKPKREGVSGVVANVVNNGLGELQDALWGDYTGAQLEIWNTKDDLTGGVRPWRPTDPIRTCAMKLVGTLSITPKTGWVPFNGQLKILYSAVYEEYIDRIEIHLADISIAGGLKFSLDTGIPLTRPTTVLEGVDPFALQYPMGGTMALPARPPQKRRGEDIKSAIPVKGGVKIKQLSLKEELNAATFTYNRRTGAYGFSSIGEQQFRVLVTLVLMFFFHFTCSYTNLSKEREW